MNDKTPTRRVPSPNTFVDSQPFWDAAQRGELVLQYCLDTGRFQHYPRPVSIYTGSRNLEWRPVSGRGTVYSYTVTRVPAPGFQDRVPYVIATVELDEGVRMVANLNNVSPDEVTIGMPVKLCWERLSETVNNPAFEPA